MISDATKEQIISIWEAYLVSNKTVLDPKGRVIPDIDTKRENAIPEIKELIDSFLKRRLNVSEFKTAIDGYNKRNNLWGFTAAKGQMFFNQLVKTNEQDLEFLVVLLMKSIDAPSNLITAVATIDQFERHVRKIFDVAADKRKAPNPGSIGYFLSYFWQIHDPKTWPVFYTSLVNSFTEIGIWINQETQAKNYESFYNLNNEIRGLLSDHTKTSVSHWDVEHAFWLHSGNPRATEKASKATVTQTKAVVAESQPQLSSGFDLNEYVIPRVANLVQLGSETEKNKASEYERLVSEVFRLLDFEVKILGQGRGRNPDAILRYREENTAFVVDAKAYRDGYSMGVDDRAIKEYILHHCPQLQKEGYKTIGFIIVSNSFKSDLEAFINEITWNTDIKRFILLTSEALLYLLAYKTKDKRDLSTIIDGLVSIGGVVTKTKVIEQFDDI